MLYSGRQSAVLMTFIWSMGGGLLFALEYFIMLSHGIKEDISLHAATYLIPPIVFGYPFARLEHSLFVQRLKISWKYILLFRFFFYLLAIGLVYHFLKIFLAYHGMGVGNYFELKFIMVWGTVLLFFLLLKNVISHFDKKTIKSWMLGQYYQPIEEERIFLFIDINHSTTIAEEIGSRKYFDLLNEFHVAVEQAVSKYTGEIFQYVGDEVVVSWSVDEGLKNENPIEAFFYLQETLDRNKERFKATYGFHPTIKAALHAGEVTRGELGKKKKDFAMVGDVLNTTARMYKLCKDHGVSLVISRRLLRRFSKKEQYAATSYGYFEPQGKEERIYIYAVSKKESLQVVEIG